jgi:hypothetical protein
MVVRQLKSLRGPALRHTHTDIMMNEMFFFHNFCYNLYDKSSGWNGPVYHTGTSFCC